MTYTAGDTTPPTPGSVTASSTQFGSFVSSPFTLTTSFTDNESAVTGCEYTINGGASWLPATVSGSAPSFTCTMTGITGSNGQVLTLAMRATSGGGTGTASAVTGTIDAAAPTTASDAPAAWVVSDQTVTLTPSDGTGTGVASTEYCTDTANSCTPDTSGTSVTVGCPDGAACKTYVRYRSTDQVGNVEATQSALVRIDKAPWVASPGPVFTSDPSLLDGYPNDPWVMMDGSTYVMYYGATIGDFSDTNTVRIFRAASGDGINWTRDSIPRLSPGAEGSWDSVKVERPSAMKLPDSTYRMYYAGSNVRDAENGFQIGLATSDDGAGWSTYPGNPVLPFGEIGSFDDASISGACVLVKDGEYWMWYVGMSGGDSRMSIGHARSQDGIVWEKKGQVLQLDVEAEGLNEVGVSDSHVIWNGTEFEMFYAVLQNDGHVPGPIWHAASGDGVSWIKDSGPILRRGAVDSWTGQGMGSPRVLLEGDTYRMWYSGTQTDWTTSFQTAIGVAEKVR